MSSFTPAATRPCLHRQMRFGSPTVRPVSAIRIPTSSQLRSTERRRPSPQIWVITVGMVIIHEITDTNLDGNVVIFRNVSGSSFDFNLLGGMLGGIQIVEILDVNNNLPVIQEASISENPVTGTMATLSASATDLDSDPLTYTWSVQSAPTGSSPEVGPGANTTITFDKSGSYELMLEVKDGRAGGVDTATIGLSSVTVNGVEGSERP